MQSTSEELMFGGMWQDLEVPSSPFSHSSSSSSSSSPSSFSSPSPSSIIPPCITIIPPSLSYETQPLLNTDTQCIKKRKIPEGNEQKHTPHLWQEYAFGPQSYPLLDSITLERMSNVDVAAQIVNPNCFYSQEYSAWVCYRQNQFKVVCILKGPSLYTLCVNDKGIPKKIEGFYAKIYAVKEVAGVHGDGMRVGLHKVGKNRLKSAKNDVEITPFVKGKIEYSNLQFEKSNAAKKPLQQSEFFHLVLILYAKCDNTLYPVLSKISAKIIVRGQNPGFYKDEDEACTYGIHNNRFNFFIVIYYLKFV